MGIGYQQDTGRRVEKGENLFEDTVFEEVGVERGYDVAPQTLDTLEIFPRAFAFGDLTEIVSQKGYQRSQSLSFVQGKVGESEESDRIVTAKDGDDDLDAARRRKLNASFLLGGDLCDRFSGGGQPFLVKFTLRLNESTVKFPVVVHNPNRTGGLGAVPPHRSGQNLVEPIFERGEPFGLEESFQPLFGGERFHR
jgi:hypothetical protein